MAAGYGFDISKPAQNRCVCVCVCARACVGVHMCGCVPVRVVGKWGGEWWVMLPWLEFERPQVRAASSAIALGPHTPHSKFNPAHCPSTPCPHIPANPSREAVQWVYFGYLGAVKEQDGAAMSMVSNCLHRSRLG